MLFELVDKFSELKPVQFKTLREIGCTEKDLEDLLARHLFDVLFQETPLLPFYQERPYEAVADIYALNQAGDVVIFELKLRQVDSSALDQLLRYAEEAGLWSYAELDRRFRIYQGQGQSVSLREAHGRAFNIEPGHELPEDQFNRQQHLWVVGSAAADHLVRRVDYWKSKGLSIDFFPYRIYQLGGKPYFEFFAKPYDRHLNPGLQKGVLFDTNRSWDFLREDGGYGCLRDMLTKSRVAAYGDRKEAVLCFQKGDFVFFSHSGQGIVGAAKVIGGTVKKKPHDVYGDEWYWDVELLTRVPADFGRVPAMSFSAVSSLLGKEFFWARINKYPYLSVDESERLTKELQRVLGPTNAAIAVTAEQPVVE